MLLEEQEHVGGWTKTPPKISFHLDFSCVCERVYVRAYT